MNGLHHSVRCCEAILLEPVACDIRGHKVFFRSGESLEIYFGEFADCASRTIGTHQPLICVLSLNVGMRFDCGHVHQVASVLGCGHLLADTYLGVVLFQQACLQYLSLLWLRTADAWRKA